MLPRVLPTWPLADLHLAVAALEAADTAFERGAAPPASTTIAAHWRIAIEQIEQVLATSGARAQAAAAREAMTTAAAKAATPTMSVMSAVRTTAAPTSGPPTCGAGGGRSAANPVEDPVEDPEPR